MSFTYGFYNSMNHDRQYNAEQMSAIFDGIINDGVLASVGEIFAVVPGESGMQVIVKTGRAWFDHTWSLNDSWMPLMLAPSDITMTRFDAVVLEVDATESVRENSIKIVEGIPSMNPVWPILMNTESVHQHALAYVKVNPNATSITGTDIDIRVGKSDCPFVTGPLETAKIDDLFQQWDSEWWQWFEGIKLALTEDVVTNLQYQIDQIRSFNYDVPSNILRKWGFDPSEIIDKNFASILAKIYVPELKTVTTSYTSDTTWVKPDGVSQVTVRLFGGGAAGRNGNGGGGGYMYYGTVTIPDNISSVPITIGKGGSNGYVNGSSSGNGGVTSFGTYASASGGSIGGLFTSGGSGGSGGGGKGGNSVTGSTSGVDKNLEAGVPGGSGSYGGGGGGGGGWWYNDDGRFGSGGSGGSGGSYGGGGGGGGGGRCTNSNYSSGGSGIASGGSGGSGSVYSYNYTLGTSTFTKSATNGSSGYTGTNTLNIDGVEFKGSGSGGSGGSVSSPTVNGGGGGGGGGGYGGSGGSGGSVSSANGGGGGGGGGYGGSGGSGGSGVSTPGGGGGGGGYGARGGNGSEGRTISGRGPIGGGGGGGGGYGAAGSGGNGIASTSSSPTGTEGKGGIAAGGGGASDSTYGGNGGDGICILTYSYYEYAYGKPGS